MPPHPEADFVSWFTSQGGTVSSSVQVFNYGQGQGRGARATADIPAEATLFSIPRNLVLSTTTASLPSKLSPQEWASVNEHGWCGLILCLLYEAALGSQSRWAPYFALLPTEFNSLMWWSEAELEELKGSMVLDKIGRQAAEQDYHQYVVPLLRKRSDVFQTVGDESKFSVHAYHVMGSLILSRSFNVDPAGHDAEDDDEEQQQHTDVSMASGSSNIGDVTGHSDQLADEDPNGEDSDGEEEASAGHVAMVPFADILNAKSGANNAELSYESEHLVMKSVKPIKKSEQIYNTYASPPNSDLLRRYGHVDEATEFDVVEIDAQLVASVVGAAVQGASEQRERKIEWLLESGLDDVYSLTHSELIPEELVSSILLFASSSQAFDKMVQRNSWPQPQDDKPTLKLLKRVLQARLNAYSTTLADDRTSVLSAQGRRRLAVLVRMGEKDILESSIRYIDNALVSSKGTKRKTADHGSGETVAKRGR